MKGYFYILLLLVLYSCNGKVADEKKAIIIEEVITEERNILKLKDYAQNYNANKIDLSQNDSLNEFDLNFTFNDDIYIEEKELKDYISNTILLKQYLFHLKKSNQGYDLMSMRKGQAKFIIDYFLKSNQLDTNIEFLNSVYPYEILRKKDKINMDIKNIIEEIEKEKFRINNATGEIINK